jgi:glycosyltransferase involved in cell wall biosynthesis
MPPIAKPEPNTGPAGTLGSRGIVAFGDVDWNGVWYSRHNILSRLAKTIPVLVVGRPFEARDVVTLKARGLTGAHRVADRLWSYRAPRFAPKFYRPPWLTRGGARLRAAHLQMTWRRLGMRDPIYYVFLPEFEPEVERLPPSVLCYHCYDKYDAYVGHDAGAAAAVERRVLARADVVIAASSALARDLTERGGRNVKFLPHGVDVRPFEEAGATPAELAAIPRPRIGYVARIDERIDVEALEAVAAARPDWSIVIIGPEAFQTPGGWAAWQRLSAHPNVHRLGGKEQSSIPAYIAGLDVGVLSYRRDNWGRWVQPIKAYEYLACGKPVVSSDIEAAAGFGDLVRVARSASDWVAAIGAALREDGAELRVRRVAFARENSWDRRVASLERALEDALAPDGRGVSGAHDEPRPRSSS